MRQCYFFQRFHVLITGFRTLDILFLYRYTKFGILHIIISNSIVNWLIRIANGPRSSRVLQLIFQLNTNNTTTIFIEKSLQLRSNFSIKPIYIFQILPVIGTNQERTPIKPIRYTPISDFSVTERSYTNERFHIMLLTKRDKFPKILITVPIKNTFCFLVNIPENISANNIHSSRLNLQYLFFPLFIWNTGIMYLSHNRDKRRLIQFHIITIYRYRTSVRSHSTQIQITSFYYFIRYIQINLICRLCICPVTITTYKTKQCPPEKTSFIHNPHFFRGIISVIISFSRSISTLTGRLYPTAS